MATTAKNQMIRATSLLLLLLSAVSCGAETQTTPVSSGTAAAADTAEVTEAYDIPEPELPALDYGGDTFTFYITGPDSQYYIEEYIYTDQTNGETVNDAVFERNAQIEDKFNVKISAILSDDSGTTAASAAKMIQAEDTSFDVVVASNLASYTTQGYYYSFNDIPNINLDAEYWNKFCIDGLSVNHEVYLMQSDLTMDGLKYGRFIYFNKKLIEDYDLTSPYDLVEQNQWTIDNFLSLARSVSADLNGDGVMDDNDLYGMLTENGESNGNILHLSIGAGQIFTAQAEDGSRYVALNDEKEQSLIEKVSEVLNDTQYAIDYETIGKLTGTNKDNSQWTYSRQLFTQGHFLFVQNGMDATDEFRDMPDDFGIAPNPKYDESQTSYYHRCDPFSPLIAIPVTCTDTDRAGAILEYGSWLSHYTVLPAYYEVTIKQKRVRDERDLEMADIIKNSIYFEFADFFSIGVTSMLWNAYKKGTYASVYAKQEKSINKQLDKIMTQLAEQNS